MQYGVDNITNPPAPEVNVEVFNAIALVGISPSGPLQQLINCASQSDDSQFGPCLKGASIPRALSVIRSSGGGQVVVINVYNPSAHTTAVVNENKTILSQKCALTNNPVPGAKGATAQIAVTTPAALNDILAGLSVGGVQLLAGPLTLVADGTVKTELQIVEAINANSAVSGYSATATTGVVNLTGPVFAGCIINGLVAVVGSITGTMVLGTPSAFVGGIGNVLVTNVPVTGVTAVGATTTVTCTTGSGSGDILAGITVGSVQLLAGASLTFGANNPGATAAAVAAAINANTSVSGFSATSSGAVLTIKGSTAMGASINGVVPVFGTITGAVVFGTPGAMGSVILGVTGVTAVPAYTYVLNQDYTIDVYGKIVFLVAIPNSTIVRATYNYLNTSAVVAGDIIGTVNESVFTGLQLLQLSETTLEIVPKILIVPNFNTLTGVQAAMESLAGTYRMRTIYGPTSPGLTLSEAIASRGPGGPLATFNISNKTAILMYPMVYTFDPQTSTATLDDPSAACAGWMAANASLNGPEESPSNQVIPAVLGTEIVLQHSWEDKNSTAQTNQLRNAGICCIFNYKGYKWWGENNASFPTNGAVDGFIAPKYVSDITTDDLTGLAVENVDRKITSGSIKAFVNAANGYYSAQASAGWIGPDSNVKYIASRNNPTNLQQGKILFTRNTFYFVGMQLITLEEDMNVQLPSVPSN